MVILVVSDVHIGYKNSNVDKFKEFLKETTDRHDVELFVVLGDFVDMWRRDVSGIFLENNEVLQMLLELKKKTPVRCVIGNHDYHLLKLLDHHYPIQFEKPFEKKIDNATYKFTHGYEYDPIQIKVPAFLDAFCKTFSDKAGEKKSDFWSQLTSGNKKLETWIKDIIKRNSKKKIISFNEQTEKEEYFKYLLNPPKKRKSITKGWVEKTARERLKKGQVTIFGHTHRPFVSKDRRLANTGSWISDEKTPNTYLELDGKTIRLFQYGKGEITDLYNEESLAKDP